MEKPQGSLSVEVKVNMMPTGRWNPSLNEKILSQASCCALIQPCCALISCFYYWDSSYLWIEFPCSNLAVIVKCHMIFCAKSVNDSCHHFIYFGFVISVLLPFFWHFPSLSLHISWPRSSACFEQLTVGYCCRPHHQFTPQGTVHPRKRFCSQSSDTLVTLKKLLPGVSLVAQ